MNTTSIYWIRAAVLSLLLALSLAHAPASAQNEETPVKRDSLHTWIERPWNIRYVLFNEDAGVFKRSRVRVAKKNAEPNQEYFHWEEFFNPTIEIELKREKLSSDKAKSIVNIEFDKSGFVSTANTHPGPLRGRINRLLYLTLSAGDDPASRLYDLGHWFTGIGDTSTDWAPGICSGNEKPDAAMVRSDMYLYGTLFKPDKYSATFGCREWASQLYDDERPYIDVTSYVREGKVYPKYTYIRDFVGWARFGDKKPVIGKHEASWYCLHDCPNGEKPGLIPDIKVWAAHNAWSAPKPPTKAPTFPDPPAAAGRYTK